jgi:hypothetical protein
MFVYDIAFASHCSLIKGHCLDDVLRKVVLENTELHQKLGNLSYHEY